MNGAYLMATRKRLEDKVAIVTGGASGIGAGIAQLFDENGANVVIADIQDDLGQAFAKKLGQNVSYVHCDVSKEEDIINLIDTTVAKHGKLDIMFNNAGIIDNALGSILDTTKSDLDRVVSVNLIGSFLGAKHAARVMVPNNKGCILFTGSVCTAIGGISTHAYAVSKYGIIGLTKNLAAELGKNGIRVNCISPSGVSTDVAGEIPLEEKAKYEVVLSKASNLKGPVLKVDGVAQAALYLASDEAYFVSGVNLLIDGGYSVVNPSISLAFQDMGLMN